MHNVVMEKYKDHIAIIGSGIAGLTIGCILLKEGVPSVIFEKHSELGSHGAGISLSPNALRVLRYMGLKDEVEKISKLTLTTKIQDNTKTLYTSSSNVRTTSREMLYKILLNKYESYGGKIIYNHELRAIDSDSSKVFFLNNSNFLVKHVIACDGIKSVSRNSISESASIPLYSGYSAWRGIIKSEDNSINLHLSKNSHIVSYPINNEFTSFVAVIKTANEYKEAWKTEGSVDEMRADLSMHPTKLVNRLAKSNELFKWGIYKRRDVNKLFVKNITFLGDAAHPIVPFLGQGGCMALEDAYIFGKLLIKNREDITHAQREYKRLRAPRLRMVKRMSETQGYLYHLSNPFITSIRNFLMRKSSSTTDKRLMRIWDYDPNNDLK
jgi:2-polyprenyl-6-methoxyphenol hydroxylase-like FAD-dependent oxidoreductase